MVKHLLYSGSDTGRLGAKNKITKVGVLMARNKNNYVNTFDVKFTEANG